VQSKIRAKLSSYPRAVMPKELKERFEIDMNLDLKNSKMRSGTATSIYENLYNDEFWKKDNQKLPFFDQFRPETCYRWASPYIENAKRTYDRRP